jgi:Protein of unknown function (DUF3592)
MQRTIGKAFILIGFVLIAVAAWAANRQYTILKHWPTVDAEVAESRVVQGTDSDGAVMYRAAIQFRYSVNGKEYSTPVASNVGTTNYISVKRQVDKYAPGTRHPIWHNPDAPDDVRFDAGYNFNFFFLPVLLGGMGVVFAGLGLAVVVVLRPKQTDNTPA